MSAFSRFRAAMAVVVVVVMVPVVEDDDDEEAEDLLVVSVDAATALLDSEYEDGALTAAFVEASVKMVGSVPAAVGPLEME